MLAHVTIAAIFLFVCTQGAPLTPEGDSVCVSDCSDRPNGDYQSCQGCNVYVTCAHGVLYDNRPCATPDLVWDDAAKKCLYTSTTCGVNAAERNHNVVAVQSAEGATGTCVSDCSGLPNGDYQSCRGCDIYVTCSHGNMYDFRPCPAGLVWNDNNKRCEWWSPTCSAATAAGECVSSCRGVQNGDYQSCLGCDVYVTCANELVYDSRPCPSGLVWDDNKKLCDFVSGTCSEESSNDVNDNNNNDGESSSNSNNNNGGSTDAENNAGGDTGSSCITSCSGLPDGDYQSCRGCSIFASCSNGGIIDNRPCAVGLVWDDTLKQCAGTSTTCTEPDDGSGSA